MRVTTDKKLIITMWRYFLQVFMLITSLKRAIFIASILGTAESATLHYELWKMTRNEDSCQMALTLYQTLYQSTPPLTYKRGLRS
jgi:hypothetical protein